MGACNGRAFAAGGRWAKDRHPAPFTARSGRWKPGRGDRDSGRPCLSTRQSVWPRVGRSAIGGSHFLDRPGADGRRPTGYSRHSLWPGFAMERDAGRSLHVQDQAADRAHLRRHALSLHPGRRALPRERGLCTSVDASIWLLVYEHWFLLWRQFSVDDARSIWTSNCKNRSNSGDFRK